MERRALLRRGLALEGVTVGYNALEGIIAIAAGLAADSVALRIWNRLGHRGDKRRCSLVAAAGGAGRGARRVCRGSAPRPGRLHRGRVGASARHWRSAWGERVGIVLTALSLIVMPLLARAKLRVAASLGSRALRADAHETIVCAWLSATTLLGLGLNAALGWWWADPVAALAMVPLIVREGLEAWRAEPLLRA